MDQDTPHTPLTDEELDRLQDLLDSLPEAMNLEMLDGFLTALVCSPQYVPPSDYLPVALGEAEGAFATPEVAEDCLGLLMRHWNAIVRDLRDEEFHDPILFEDEDGQPKGNEWAEGFLEGMSLGGEGWRALALDEARNDLLLPVFILGHEHDSDPQLRPEPITAEMRLELLGELTAVLPDIYRHFELLRREASLPPESRPARRTGPKIGRNDPCPCGSGRKFKQCCGKS